MTDKPLPGSDGLWNNRFEIATFVRHLVRKPPTVYEVAIHEAGHIVVGHLLGYTYKSVTAQHNFDALAVDYERWGENCFSDESATYFNDGERILTSLAGVVADEIQKRYDPICFGSGEDEAQALAAMTALCDGHQSDQVEKLTILGSCRYAATKMLRKHWPDVERFAKELADRDLNGDDVTRILGPTPKPRNKRTRHKLGGMQILVSFTDTILAALTLLVDRPFAVALLKPPFPAGYMWLNKKRELIATYEDGTTEVVARAQA